jgi:folate-dependent phosphoribosylglycinamide formyltransferase PurN
VTGAEPHAWETGLMDTITYVGLDVHKPALAKATRRRGATVSVVLAEGGRGGEIRQVGVSRTVPS